MAEGASSSSPTACVSSCPSLFSPLAKLTSFFAVTLWQGVTCASQNMAQVVSDGLVSIVNSGSLILSRRLSFVSSLVPLAPALSQTLAVSCQSESLFTITCPSFEECSPIVQHVQRQRARSSHVALRSRSFPRPFHWTGRWWLLG